MAKGTRNDRPTGKSGKKPLVTVTVTTRPGKPGNRAPGPPPPSHTGIYAGVGSPGGRRR